MKKLASSIVKILDWLACIIPSVLLLEDCDIENTPINPITYGMSVMGGLIVCACGAVGALVLVAGLVCVVLTYPITSCSVAVAVGMFVGIGFLRKKIGRKLDDCR